MKNPLLEKIIERVGALRNEAISYEGSEFERGMVASCDIMYKYLTSLENSSEIPNSSQFTPGQEIEVSNDGEKWEKRTFQNMIKEKFQCWQTEEEHNKTTMFLKLWQFARPLEQVTIPEFDYDKIHMEAMKDHVGSFATHVAHPLCKQMSEITRFLHSKFPNNKPGKN